jgi:hypothetical protein
MNQKLSGILYLLTFTLVWMYSCKKETFITDASAVLETSKDTIRFDTVFTTTGSVTQSLKIYNRNNEKLRLERLRLMGGNASAFQMNVNGVSTTIFNNIEINANDSIYVFISVSINPNNQNLPFLVSDSIEIGWNGNSKFIQLSAFGQNAHFIRDTTIQTNTVWTNDLPYVIEGGLTIPENTTLTLNAGCRVYVHANTPIRIEGTLVCNGEKNNEVVFRGDRLDEYYRDIPGGWKGLTFGTFSKDNVLAYTKLLNADTAVCVKDPSVNNNKKLDLRQCIINNAMGAGVFASKSSLSISNSLLSNCGRNVLIILGGDYEMTNCTLAAYSNAFMLHRYPVLEIGNYDFSNGGILTNDLNTSIINTVLWGSGGINEDELKINREGTRPFNVSFDHCLYKATSNIQGAVFQQCLLNTDPLFDSIDVSRNYYDFHTINNPVAPGIDRGIQTGFLRDLDNLPRWTGTSTDLGCYEKP